MENIWEKLRTLKGRSWTEAKDVLSKIKDTGNRIEEIVVSYKINSETLSEEDREIYGVYPKQEPFFLERCKLCSRLLKPTVLHLHYDFHHKRNSNNAKKTSFVSPSKKKYSRKGNKSTSEDDSESVISSETPSPALDLQENSLSNLDSSGKEDAMIDVISVEEIPSEDSKPPTPGPQDLYEGFAVPNADETSNTFSSTLESDRECRSVSNSKSLLKLKITTNRDREPKIQSTTSLLEAHLLSNTKYNNVGDSKYKNSNFKFNVVPYSKSEPNTVRLKETKSDECEDLWKNKNETKISIPISMLPQNVKIIGSLKKNAPISKPASSPQRFPNDSKEKFCNSDPSSPLSTESIVELNSDEKSEKSTKSKKNKRSKVKNRYTKNIEYDPNKHCGVLIDENRRCLRSLTCKTHLISLRRAVEGRSKEFDKLLADHRASKEILKEQERGQTHNLNLSEPIISLPMLTADKITGNTIHISSANNESEIVKIRVPNVITNPEIVRCDNTNVHAQNDYSLKSDNDRLVKKYATEVAKNSAATSKPTASVKSEIKSQLYENDIRISFVCSNMLYKIGGLLYMDRSRQAVRKCVDPLIKKDVEKTRVNRRAINLPTNGPVTNLKLTAFDDENAENMEPKKDVNELKAKANEELNRMKETLAASCEILQNLSTDENVIKKLKICRKLKRKNTLDGKNSNTKKFKDNFTDENYDINTLLSFDKNVDSNDTQFNFNDTNFQTRRENYSNISNIIDHIPYNVFLGSNNFGTAGPTASSASGAATNTDTAVGNYNGNDTAHIIQSFKDLENEICNSVDYTTQPIVDYIATANVAENNVEFVENCDNEFKVIDNTIANFDENIVKNYSLIEEYCKTMTDELFLDDKNNFEFYENADLVNGNVKNTRNNVIVVSDGKINEDNLNIDNQLLNAYLSSISAGEINSQNIEDVNLTSRQFDLTQVEPQGQLIEQFQDNTAVNIDQSATPVVCTKADSEEVLKWLF